MEKNSREFENRPMRRQSKELRDEVKISYLLKKTRTGFLGLVDEEGTYVVPLNYVWYKDNIYFHGSNEGRKYDALLKGETYCFTVIDDYGTIADPIPANIGTAYTSAMVFGKVEMVADLEEAKQAMEAMLNKYVPGYFDTELSKKHLERYRSSMGSPTVVYRIIPDRITAKEVSESFDNLYLPGRKQQDDLKR